MGKSKKEVKTNTKQKQTVKKETKGLVIDSIKPEFEKVEENEDMSVNIPVEYVVENNEENIMSDTDETKNEEKLEDTLNVEQEQGVYEENETIENISEQEIQSELETTVDTPILEDKKNNPKKSNITTNEMFGYNWMGQVYDY